MSPGPEESKDDQEKASREHYDVSDMETPQVMIAVNSSSDSDDDEGDEESPMSLGYQMLPQDSSGGMGPASGEDGPECYDEDAPVSPQQAEQEVSGSEPANVVELTELDGADSDSRLPLSATEVPPLKDSEAKERHDLWSSPRTEESQRLEEEQVEKVKSAMAGFNLPAAHVPDWARLIPEDEWKSQLFSQVCGGSIDDLPHRPRLHGRKNDCSSSSNADKEKEDEDR